MFRPVFCSLVQEMISAKIFVFSTDRGKVVGLLSPARLHATN